ncbi:MAG: hypothetical protein ABEK59_07110 [Halobacteria archaeon]
MEVDGDTHLAVSYEDGIKKLEYTGRVLRNLKKRAGELGVLSDYAEPYVINDLGREHDVHIDFYSVPPGKTNGLDRAKKEDHPPQTEYMFLGTSRRDEVAAEKHGWKYRDFDEVAREEGWSLKD